jgi:hypothetical protein
MGDAMEPRAKENPEPRADPEKRKRIVMGMQSAWRARATLTSPHVEAKEK